MLRQFLHPDLDRPWVGGERPESLGELVTQSERIAAHLGGRTLGGRIVVSCRLSRSFVPGLFGSWLTGATVELLPNVQPATLDRVDADDDVIAVLHDDPGRTARSAKSHFVPSLVLGRMIAAPAPTMWPELAIRMTTSGTTQQPKYVAKTTAQLLRELEVLAQVLSTATCALSTVPLSHLYGVLWGALLPLRIGARIASHHALLPADLRDAIERDGVDTLISTPAHLRAMLDVPMPRNLRVISSGARLAPELHMQLELQHGWRVTDVLGSTETGGIALRTDPTSSWLPLPGVAVSAPSGRLAVASPWCERMELDDQVEIEPDGRFRYLGRNDEVIKIAGKRAHAQALELAVLGIRGIVDAAVLPHTGEGREPRVAMAIVVEPHGAAVDRDAIAKAIRDQFDLVFVPKLLSVVARIPRTERGKVDRTALRALLTGSAVVTHQIVVERIAPGQYAAEVPHNLVFFCGHFDAVAILPGAVVVERLLWPIVRREWPEISRLRGLRRLRFRRPICPGQRLAVTVKRDAIKVLAEVACGSSTVASAQMLVE